MRLKIILYFIGIVIILCASSCMTTKSQEQEVVSINLRETYDLSDSDLDSAKKMAMRGDGEAAFKVSNYYGIAHDDGFTGLGWLLLAANNGYVDAQTVLGSAHLEGHALENLELAEYWFKKAAKNGSKGAKRILETIKQSKKSKLTDF